MVENEGRRMRCLCMLVGLCRSTEVTRMDVITEVDVDGI